MLLYGIGDYVNIYQIKCLWLLIYTILLNNMRASNAIDKESEEAKEEEKKYEIKSNINEKRCDAMAGVVSARPMSAVDSTDKFRRMPGSRATRSICVGTYFTMALYYSTKWHTSAH